MSDAEITLHRFFGWDEIHLTKLRLSSIDASNGFNHIRNALSKEAGNIKSLVTREWLIKEVGNVLKRIQLTDILVGAWNKSRQLNKYRDPQKYPPDEPVFVSLLEHPITSKQRPSIEVLLGEGKIGEVQLEINVNLTVQGVVLKIEGGKIKEIRSASIKGKGQIKIEGAELFEKEIPPFKLPGVIELGEGKSIEHVASAAQVA